MTVLVTGGAGFIGSHITERLTKPGYSVMVLDDLSTGNKKNMKGFITKVEFVKESYGNRELLKKSVFRREDDIYHSAHI